jgi:hypothetical protein
MSVLNTERYWTTAAAYILALAWLTAGPETLSKKVIHGVRFSASAFNIQYPLFSSSHPVVPYFLFFVFPSLHPLFPLSNPVAPYFLFFVFPSLHPLFPLSHPVRPSLHFIQLDFTPLHYTSPNYVSPKFTSLHFTQVHFTPLYYTLPKFTSLHFSTLHFLSFKLQTNTYLDPVSTGSESHLSLLSTADVPNARIVFNNPDVKRC